MQVKRIYILIAAVIILGIMIYWYYTLPIIVAEGEKPNLAVDISPFIDAGCVIEDDRLDCSSIGLEEKYSCEGILSPSEYLGGLTPKVPIVECLFEKRDWGKDEGIVRRGCRRPWYNKYIVLVDGKFKLISNKEEFKQFFAPVETPEEALSFVVALTNSFPMYEIKIPRRYVVFVTTIEPTYVKEVPEGFQVHLFSHTLCGCGPHPYYAIDYLVTKAGENEVISRQKIYKDPLEDDLCVD